MSAGAHFCAHGNLRYSCAECRAERRRSAPPIERTTYGRLRTGAPLPGEPWRLDGALGPHEEAAVAAVTDAGGGVVVLPAPLGLRKVALALLRRLHHETGPILFLVPTVQAVAAWAAALSRDLHVASEDIDDQGRNIQDWARLRPVTLWTPELLLRHASGIRQHAAKIALFVDSPTHTAYEPVATLLAAPFARRVGIGAARLGAAATASPVVDALGGVVHRLDVAQAQQVGLLRSARHEIRVHTGAREAAIVDAVARGKTARAWVWVDDTAAAGRLDAAASRAGLDARIVTGAASADAAARAARAVSEGAARLFITTPDAPSAAPGPVDLFVCAADTLAPGPAGGQLLAQLAAPGGSLTVLDIVDRDEGDDAAAARLVSHAAAFATPLPDLAWLRTARPVPPLPADVAQAVTAAAPRGWSAVQGQLAELLAEGWEETAALAALADRYIAAALGVPDVMLGPAPAEAPDAVTRLAGPFPAWQSLAHLALQLPDARGAWAALLARDVPRVADHHADGAVLHHLVPDVRTLLLATFDDVPPERLMRLDPSDPHTAAVVAVSRGPRIDLEPPAAAPPRGDALSADDHRTHLLEAIGAERAHEIEESVLEIAQLSGNERQRLGRTLFDLTLVAKRRSDRGLELHYAPAAPAGRPRPLLPYTDLGPGALVDLSLGDRYDPLMRGTVTAVDAQEITLVVADDADRRAPAQEARIDQVANPRVFDVLERAVRTVYGGADLIAGGGALRGHLLGKNTARPAGGAVHLMSARLNRSQADAVAAALHADPVSLIHGPPGTGKTTTLVELVRQAVHRGERVLVTADSNAAVDAIMDAYLQAGGVAVRTGPRPSLTRTHLAGNHLDALTMRAPGVDWLRRVPVVFTTHVSSAGLPRAMTFDRVVQDEASQATEPASCVSLLRGPRLVLAGDHLQLPPVVRSEEAAARGLSISLFERLHAAYGAPLGRLLSVQYRMHPDIEAWSNARFYGGRIQTAVEPEPLAAAVASGLLPAAPRALFVDVAGAERADRTSKERAAEAEWINRRVRALLEAGVRAESVAVIAAYRAQVRLLRNLLVGTQVDVGTIDAFQGSERDLVFVSLVRGNPRGEVGFVREPRRLNVAVTRARRHLVVVGDRATLSADPTLASLLDALHPLPSGEA